MVNLYEDYQLPRKYRAVMKIRQQPFFGQPGTRLEIRWCTSHRFWMVGTLRQVLEQDHKFNREYLTFLRDQGLDGEEGC